MTYRLIMLLSVKPATIISRRSSTVRFGLRMLHALCRVVDLMYEFCLPCVKRAAVHLVLKGARLIGTNCDLKDRMLDSFVPACGSLIKPIELATGREAYFCGKPNPLIMRAAISKLGVKVKSA